MDKKYKGCKKDFAELFNSLKTGLGTLKSLFEELKKYPKKGKNGSNSKEATEMLELKDADFDVELFIKLKDIAPSEKIRDIREFVKVFPDFFEKLDIVSKNSVDVTKIEVRNKLKKFVEVFQETWGEFLKFERVFGNKKKFLENSPLILIRDYYNEMEGFLKKREELGGEDNKNKPSNKNENLPENKTSKDDNSRKNLGNKSNGEINNIINVSGSKSNVEEK